MCGVSFPNRSKLTFQFSRNENLQLSTHTHIRTQPRKSAHATKKLPSCRGQLLHPSPFPLPSLVLFRPVIAIYALERPFLFVSHCLSIPNQRFLSRFIDRLSRYWIVRSILTTFVYLYRCYAEYLRETKFLLWNYLVSFSFVRRDCCYFFPSDGKWSIAWKVVGNISRGDKLKNCFGFEFFRQESSTDFLKFGFHPNENSREENNLFRRISF